MTLTTMSKDLDSCYQALAELETQRIETLAELGGWSPNCLSFRPAPTAWTAIEVLDHIVRAETGTLGDLQEGLRNPHPLGTEERPRVADLDRALRSDRSFQVPAGAEEIRPDPQTTWAQVTDAWALTRKELGQLVQSLGPGDTRCGLFCHPFAGWMTFEEVLQHFSAHLYHHRFQLARIRASFGDLQTR